MSSLTPEPHDRAGQGVRDRKNAQVIARAGFRRADPRGSGARAEPVDDKRRWCGFGRAGGRPDRVCGGRGARLRRRPLGEQIRHSRRAARASSSPGRRAARRRARAVAVWRASLLPAALSTRGAAGQGGFPPQPGLPQAPAQTASLQGPPRYLADPNARYMPYAYAPQPQQPPPNYGYPPASQPQAAATATTPPQRVVRRRAPARAPKNGIFFIN